MSLMNFSRDRIVEDTKKYAAGTVSKVLEEIDKRRYDPENMSEEEKAIELEKAARRAARREAAIQKARTYATNAAQRIRASIENKEAERQAAYEAEVQRLRDSYPIEMTLLYPDDGWLNKAKVVCGEGNLCYTIKTSSFLGIRKIILLDINNNSAMKIEENRAAFSPFGGERETHYIISVDNVQKATTRREVVKFHNMFYLNEYKWHTQGKSYSGQIMNQRDEIIAEWLTDRKEDSRVMMFFQFPETVMLSMALIFVKRIESSHSFSDAYSRYYMNMSERSGSGEE